jgi:hypothetical protein
MATINEVLQSNRFAVSQLLRRYRVIGEPNMQTIERAFNRHGEAFMLKLLDIITPDHASFTALIEPKQAIVTSSGTLDTKTLATSQASTGTTASTGKFWKFWDDLLTGISKTGETLGEFKANLETSPTDYELTDEEKAAQQNRTRMLFWVVGAIIVLMLLILIFKKR